MGEYKRTDSEASPDDPMFSKLLIVSEDGMTPSTGDTSSPEGSSSSATPADATSRSSQVEPQQDTRLDSAGKSGPGWAYDDQGDLSLFVSASSLMNGTFSLLPPPSSETDIPASSPPTESTS